MFQDYEYLKRSIEILMACLQLSVTINLPGEDAYLFQTRLFGKVLPGFYNIIF